MKNLSIFIILASLLFNACSEKIVEQDLNVVLPDLTVSIEEDFTRTYVEGKKLYWNAADEISVFYGSTVNSQYRFLGNDGDTGGTFSSVSGSTGNDLSAIYAVYPYQGETTITNEGTISLELPSIQQYSVNSFGKGANTMIGVSENLETSSVSFKNACGYLKLRLYGNVTVKSIMVKGNNDEKIAGAATATIAYGGVPSLTMGSSATKSVTINCGEGVTLGTTSETATEFWFVLPVTKFIEGISIEVNTADGNVFEKSTSNTVSIVRNEIQPMAALEVKDEILMPENEEIRYTTTDKNIVEPIGFNAESIVSNEYVNGQGVITFGENVTSIPEEAFANIETLISIYIPATVEEIGSAAFSGCEELATVYCLAQTPPTFSSNNIFGNILNNTTPTIYVPSDCLKSYETEWSAYASYINGL